MAFECLKTVIFAGLQANHNLLLSLDDFIGFLLKMTHYLTAI